jgi:hypothetical protein
VGEAGVMGEVGVTTRLPVCCLGVSVLAASAYERLRVPRACLDILFCWVGMVGTGCSAIEYSVRAGNRSVRRLIVEELMRGSCRGDTCAAESDSRGAQRREADGCPSPIAAQPRGC